MRKRPPTSSSTRKSWACLVRPCSSRRTPSIVSKVRRLRWAIASLWCWTAQLAACPWASRVSLWALDKKMSTWCGTSHSWVATRSRQGTWRNAAQKADSRCSEYRGSTVPFASCLNLSRQQYALSMTAEPPQTSHRAPFKPQLGPQPVVQMRNFVPAQGKTVYRAPAPATSTTRHYDQAARNKLPPAPPAHKYGTHTDRLAGLLGGAASREQWRAQPTSSANGLVGHIAHTARPHAESTRSKRGGGMRGRGRGQ